MLSMVFACQKENLSNPLTSEAKTQTSTTKTVSADDIPEVMNFIASKSADYKFVLDDSNTSDGMNRSHEDNLVMTTLILDEITQVTNAYQKSNYTFRLIKQGDLSGKYFLNLVVKEYMDTFYLYIVKYVPDDNWLNTHSITNDFADFTGMVYFYSDEGIYIAKATMANGSSVATERHPCGETDDDDTNDYPIDDGDNGDDGSGGGGGGGDTCVLDISWYECGGPNSDIPHTADECGVENGTGSGITATLDCSGTGDKSMNDFLRHPCEGSGGGGGTPTANCTPDPTVNCEFPMQWDENCNCVEAQAIENGEIGIITPNYGKEIALCLGGGFTVSEVMTLNASPSIDELYDYMFDDFGNCNLENPDFAEVIAEELIEGGEVDIEDDIILKDSSFVNNQKASCIYNKLSQSPKFKTLFIDTFGENDNLNVTFKVDNLTNDNGITENLPGSESNYNPNTGEVNLNLQIVLDNDYINSSSAIAVAKTILHESIHAYLILKHVKCNIGTPFDDIIDEIEDKNLEELLNYYYDTACSGEEQHEFMFEHMIPTMSDILAEIRDELIPENHQQSAEELTFIDETNPSGPYVNWDWSEFYKYLSMAGLQNTDAFQFEMLPNNSPKYQNFTNYINTGINSFAKYCID